MTSNRPLDSSFNGILTPPPSPRDSDVSNLGQGSWEYTTGTGLETRSISDESISSASSSSSIKSTCSKCAHFVLSMLYTPFTYLRDLLFGKPVSDTDIRMKEALEKLKTSSVLSSSSSTDESVGAVGSVARDFAPLKESLENHVISTLKVGDIRGSKSSILFDLLGYEEIASSLSDIIYRGHKVKFANDDGFFYETWARSEASDTPILGTFSANDGVLTYHISKEMDTDGIEFTSLRVTTYVDSEDVPIIEFDDLDEDACGENQHALLCEAHETAHERMRKFYSVGPIERQTIQFKSQFPELSSY